ncbi:MAG: hypothetical protein WBB25_20535 [Sulfitobacter sp.]
MNSSNATGWLYRVVMTALFCLSVFSASTAMAQSEEGESEGEISRGNFDDINGDNPNDALEERVPDNPYQIVALPESNENATASITNAIRDSYNFCGRMRRPEYLVDCVGVQLELIARSMPKTGDYSEAREILADASKKLRTLVTENRAPDKPRVRVTGTINSSRVTSKPLNAVRADRIKEVNLQAADILEEAETKLLRSAAASDRRLIAYAQMAKAVGSNKTLLRSA